MPNFDPRTSSIASVEFAGTVTLTLAGFVPLSQDPSLAGKRVMSTGATAAFGFTSRRDVTYWFPPTPVAFADVTIHCVVGGRVREKGGGCQEGGDESEAKGQAHAVGSSR